MGRNITLVLEQLAAIEAKCTRTCLVTKDAVATRAAAEPEKLAGRGRPPVLLVVLVHVHVAAAGGDRRTSVGECSANTELAA